MRWFNIQPKINKLQKEAQRKAIQIYQSDPKKYRDTMFCPFCGEPLIDSGKTRALETLSEHVCGCNQVSQKKVYVCSHEGFYKNITGCKYGVFWVWNGPEGIYDYEAGGAYYSDLRYELVKRSKDDILSDVLSTYLISERSYRVLTSALNTQECKSEVSIYNEGLPTRKVLLEIGKFKLTLEFTYKADRFGRVNKTYINLGYVWKNSIGIWPWKTWRFELKRYRNRKKMTKKGSENYYENLLAVYSHSPNRSWRYRVFEKVIEFIHFKEVKDLKKHFGFSEIPVKYGTEFENIRHNRKKIKP